MNESRIKDRYTVYLDPSLNKEPFTAEEEKNILKLYFVNGYRSKDLKEVMPDRDRNMVRSVLEVHTRQSLRKL
jgi:hypothetical protein